MKKTAPTYYDLTTSQRILFYSQSFSLYKQINNVFSLMLLDKELDFDTLRRAIVIGYEHSDATRIRMRRVKWKVKQYFLESDPPQIGLLDFTGQTREQMERELYRLAAIPVRLMNRPLSRIFLVRSWDGLQGIYLGVSHLIMDSWSICVLLKYIMDVYGALKDGTPMPKPLYPYEPLLAKDVKYEGSPQHEKDRAFWQEECKRPEPMFTHITGSSWLERYRAKKRNPNLRAASCLVLDTRAAHEIIMIPAEQVSRMEAFCEKHRIPMQSLFMMGVRTSLSARNKRESDVSFHNAVARRATQQEKRTGGTRIHVLVIRTIIEEGLSFLDALRELSARSSLMFRHAEFSLLELYKILEQAYYPGDRIASHQSIALTFQPVRMTLEDGTVLRTKWYGNGVSSQPMYLTVMDGDGSGALRCYYEYQIKVFKPEAVREFHREIVDTIMAGIENEDITVGELLNLIESRGESRPARRDEAVGTAG